MIASLTLSVLVLLFGTFHLCHLESTIIEITLLVVVPAACCFWTAGAATPQKAWGRTWISVLLAIVLEAGYLTWLHSESFPEALLSQRARETQAQFDSIRERIAEQQAGGEAEDGAAQP